jgi:hypothetical protein
MELNSSVNTMESNLLGFTKTGLPVPVTSTSPMVQWGTHTQSMWVGGDGDHSLI